MTDILTPEETPVPSPAPQRRTALGRLYHGETAIDFYGRRFIGLGISGALLVISIVSFILNTITGTGNSRIHIRRNAAPPGQKPPPGDGPVIDV